jgi:hypothetical protein
VAFAIGLWQIRLAVERVENKGAVLVDETRYGLYEFEP